ncbi:MFS transporter [Paenibacillus sp. NPDC056579]|uniref:MFS transporter n=1 Tax=Paenibacillus sp. NPDC056579 TaxID=3345871 RepID=UPI00369F4C3E
MNRLAVYLLTLGAFVTGVAELIVIGILPVIADDLHISIALAGQIITAFSLSFAIGTPIIVTLTSRVRRKHLLIGALAMFILGSLASYASTSFAALMASRIMLGLSGGVYTVVAFSSVAKLVSPEKTGRAIGMVAMGFSAALVLGAPIGVTVAKWWSWQTIFAALGVITFLLLLGTIRLLPQIAGDAPVPFRKQFHVLGSSVIVSGLGLSLLFTSSSSMMNTYLAPYLQQILHMNASYTGLTMFALGIAGVLGTRAGGTLADAWGSSKVISFGLTVLAVSLFLLPLLSSYLVAGVGLLLIWMFAMSLIIPAIQMYFIQQAPESSNLVLGLNTSVLHLGVAVGAGLGGIVVDATSTVLYNPWIASLTVAVGLAIAAVSFSRSRRKVAGTV